MDDTQDETQAQGVANVDPTTQARLDAAANVATVTAVPLAKSPVAIIERWFMDHFPGSVIARDVESWNKALAAKEDLKVRLAAVTPEKGA